MKAQVVQKIIISILSYTLMCYTVSKNVLWLITTFVLLPIGYIDFTRPYLSNKEKNIIVIMAMGIAMVIFALSVDDLVGTSGAIALVIMLGIEILVWIIDKYILKL